MYHIAQINIAEMKYPLHTPQMHDFVSNLDRINALAEAQPGFVWRFENEAGSSAEIEVFGTDSIIINMSVWKSTKDLKNFTYRTVHAEFVRRRKEWFHIIGQAHYVLWRVPAGHIPTPQEGKEKLEAFRENGPSPEVFDFKSIPDRNG